MGVTNTYCRTYIALTTVFNVYSNPDKVKPDADVPRLPQHHELVLEEREYPEGLRQTLRFRQKVQEELEVLGVLLEKGKFHFHLFTSSESGQWIIKQLSAHSTELVL